MEQILLQTHHTFIFSSFIYKSLDIFVSICQWTYLMFLIVSVITSFGDGKESPSRTDDEIYLNAIMIRWWHSYQRTMLVCIHGRKLSCYFCNDGNQGYYALYNFVWITCIWLRPLFINAKLDLVEYANNTRKLPKYDMKLDRMYWFKHCLNAYWVFYMH